MSNNMMSIIYQLFILPPKKEKEEERRKKKLNLLNKYSLILELYYIYIFHFYIKAIKLY